ncbi:choline dehydrogenase 7, partial [Perkinsus olseni]
LNLSKQELEHLIKEGAYAAFEDHSSREEEFRTASLDDIMSSDRIKTVTYGTMVSGGHRSRFSKAYFSANPETPEEIATSPDSVESGEDGAAEGADEKLSDIEFWRKLVHDEALLTTDPDAKEEKSESSIHDVGERSIRKTRYAGNFLRFRTARTDKEDRVDQEYEPQESLSENGDSDVDVEDLVDEEEALDKAMKASRKKKKKRGRGRGKKDAAAGQTSATAVKDGVGRGSHKRARVDIPATTPALQRAVAAAAAAQKAKAFASSSSSYPSIPRRTTGSSSFPPQQQQLPTMGVTSATYPYIPAPPLYPYAAVQYRGMPVPPHSIANHNVPNSRLLFPPPPMYQCASNYGMMYGMYVASRTAAAAAAAAAAGSSRPPVNPDEFLTSVDPSKIERLD